MSAPGPRAGGGGPGSRGGLWVALGPGLLVAATGVGAGDLATAAFTGAQLGTAVLWAVPVGAALKLALNEGIASHQLATGRTLLESMPRAVAWAFLVYLVLWSYFVGAALMGACGVTLHAILPAFERPETAKVAFGLAHSAAGVALVLAGGFGLFERVMRVAIGVMFVAVVATAAVLAPGLTWAAPALPDAGGAGLAWTVALIGGVGGTVTILCYGYWIREAGRGGPDDLPACRLDLSVGYATTAVFGVAMVLIGSVTPVEGKGAGLIVALADALEARLGLLGRAGFLVGAWGAVFSSLLGVWQSVPSLFVDTLDRAMGRAAGPVDDRRTAYRVYLAALATLPAFGLSTGFREAQKLYAVVGALFLPLLAIVLLVLNRRRAGWLSRATLAATLGFFAWSAWKGWAG